jgi:sugar lactone lactonase YvrE
MKASHLGRPVIGALIAVGMLAGCGVLQQTQNEAPPNGMQGSVPQETLRRPMPQGTWVPRSPRGPKRAGWLLSAAKVPGGRLLYVSEDYVYSDGAVIIYPEKGNHQSPIGMITAGVEDPWGLYVDKQQNLYVANQGGTVTVYPRGSTSPSLTFSQGLGRPLYPIVDSSGDVFVSNAGRSYTTSRGSSGGGMVVEYRPGSTSSYRVLQTPGAEADGMAFDRQGDLYVAYRDSAGTGSIEEFAPGSTQGTILGMSLNRPQGVIVDNNGNIVVVETRGSDRIDFFPPGQQTPSVEIPANVPNQLAIRRTEPRLFIASEAGYIYGIRYHFLRKHPRAYVKEELDSVVQGVALSNGQRF